MASLKSLGNRKNDPNVFSDSMPCRKNVQKFHEECCFMWGQLVLMTCVSWSPKIDFQYCLFPFKNYFNQNLRFQYFIKYFPK